MKYELQRCKKGNYLSIIFENGHVETIIVKGMTFKEELARIKEEQALQIEKEQAKKMKK